MAYAFHTYRGRLMATATENRIRGREREELAQELRHRVNGEVRFDPFSRVLYSTDASIYQMEPVGVVIPRGVEDVLAVMEVARDSGVPLLPRSGGTSLAGQTVNHAIVMDFSKYLDQMLEVNQEEHWARVQPGIVLDQLNRQLMPRGLQYASRPHHVQPGLRRRRHWQQHLRVSFRDLRQDLGPRQRAPHRALRRYSGPLPPFGSR